MKMIFFLIAVFSFSLGCHSQGRGTIKLYGYVQSVSGGKAPEMDANTGLRTGGPSRKNYRLYTVSKTRIYPSELWIEGARYGFSTTPIKKTPVEYIDDGNIGAPKKELVPKTAGQVLQLVPVSSSVAKPVNGKAKSLSTKNAVVLVYKQGAKFYYSTLASLSSLESGVAL